ncbi:MAG TPA: carbamoyltransferase N-terminal domain-containing protein [Candidatus Angelobacter sp.]
MIVLGLSGGTKRPDDDDDDDDDDVEHEHWHDAAAVLMQDREILAAIEEERLNRLKHTNCFPAQAIRYCLEDSGVSWNDLDLIVKAAEEKRLLVDAQVNALMDSHLAVSRDAAEFMNSVFQREFGVDVREKLHFCEHHEAHLWSAFVPPNRSAMTMCQRQPLHDVAQFHLRRRRFFLLPMAKKVARLTPANSHMRWMLSPPCARIRSRISA